MLRPPAALRPDVDVPPAAAIPASEVEVDDVEVVLEVAPASESDVVVVEDAFVGATAVGVVAVVVESLLWRVAPSTEVATDPTGSDSVFGVSTVAVAVGDFLISLCGLRIDV